MGFRPAHTVTLPIGLDWQGTRYREVTIDEMRGIDEEAVTSKVVRNNGAKAVTRILQRCILKIPGLIDSKSGQYEFIDEGIVQAMYTPDRDFLFLSIRALSMESSIETSVKCPSCESEQEITVPMESFDVYEWDGDAPEFSFELPSGFPGERGEKCKKVTWRVPNGKVQEQLASLPQEKIGTTAITACLVKVEGMQGRVNTEQVRRLQTRDREYIDKVVRENTPGVDLRTPVSCSDCAHEWMQEVPINSFFNKATEKAIPSPALVGTSGRKVKRAD